MKSIGISEFKAHCIGLLKRAQRSGTPLIVTHRGRPLVRIEPIPGGRRRRQLGDLHGKLQIKGDIIHTDLTSHWEIAHGD